MAEFFNHLLQEFQLPLQNPVLIFSLILFIILLSPILLRRINIPGIIGLIISGVIIGPHGLNILEQNSAIDLFSTIGLLYIMFIAGLELDMNDFRANRNKSVLFGFFTFIFPLAIGFPVCYYLLGYDFNASFLTASMFATHTLVAYPIVSKLGVAKNKAVAVTVGGTILTDTAVLIILAVIMGRSEGTLNSEFWITLGVSLAIFSAIMFLIIPRIAKWFFRVLESEKHAHYIFVLAVVFFAAFLAEVAGVEPIIGAFVAGLALNRLIPHSSALMNRIEFMGNSLFIPFFLISVGMLVDISVIFSGYMAIVIALSLSIVAIFSKWVAAFFTQMAFKYSRAQRQLIFGLSSAHAAATLAVILVGYNAEILDENILNGTIILILITCIVASFATEKAAKKLALAAEEELTLDDSDNVSGQEHILLSITNIKDINKLLEFSILIKDKKSENPISMVSIVPNNEVAELNIAKAKSRLENFVKQASATETDVKIIATIDQNINNGISRTTKEINADLIIIGWPERKGVLDKSIAAKIDDILINSDKTTFICHFNKSLVTHKRMVIISPPGSEMEKGFEKWFVKIIKLSQELSIPVIYYSDSETEVAVRNQITESTLNATMSYMRFDDWEDFLIISRDIKDDDLFVLVSARKGTVSYEKILESLPFKLEKHFAANSRILVYPYTYTEPVNLNEYEEISNKPLSSGIETIQKIGKGIGGIFSRNN